MIVANNISINFEGGYFQITGRISVAGAAENFESFIRELKFQLFGEDAPEDESAATKLAPKDLNEKDAARYIGRSVSLLRSYRYKGKGAGKDIGPKYTRDSGRYIRYPVNELDNWLEARQLYSACCEEQI
jgi:hypothetical protein